MIKKSGRYLAVTSLSLALLLSGCSADEEPAKGQEQEQPNAEEAQANEELGEEAAKAQAVIDSFTENVAVPASHTEGEKWVIGAQAQKAFYGSDKIVYVTHSSNAAEGPTVTVFNANSGEMVLEEVLPRIESYSGSTSVHEGKQYFNLMQVGTVEAKEGTLEQDKAGVFLWSFDMSAPDDKIEVVKEEAITKEPNTKIGESRDGVIPFALSNNQDEEGSLKHYIAVGTKLVETKPKSATNTLGVSQGEAVIKPAGSFEEKPILGVPGKWDIYKTMGVKGEDSNEVLWVEDGFMLVKSNKDLYLVDLESRSLVAKEANGAAASSTTMSVSNNRKFVVFNSNVVDVVKKKLTSFAESADQIEVNFQSADDNGVAYGSTYGNENIVTVNIKTGKPTVQPIEGKGFSEVNYVSSEGTLYFAKDKIGVKKP